MFSAYAVQASHREGILDRIREEEKLRGITPAKVSPLLDWVDAHMDHQTREAVVAEYFQGVK